MVGDIANSIWQLKERLTHQSGWDFTRFMEIKEHVEAWVQEALDAGAGLLIGGKRISDTCYACTVLYDPPMETKVSTMRDMQVEKMMVLSSNEL
jgi:hypothetical protein